MSAFLGDKEVNRLSGSSNGTKSAEDRKLFLKINIRRTVTLLLFIPKW